MADIAIAHADTVITTNTAGVNSRTINLATNIGNGDLVYIALVGSATDGSPNTAIMGGGWTKRETTFASSPGHATIFERKCTGAEGSSVTVTNDLDEDVAAISFRIPAALWHGTTMPEFSSAWYVSTGNDTACDPPASPTASWSGEKNLFVAFIFSDTTSGNVTAPPANYTANVKAAGGYAVAKTGTLLGGAVGVCARVLTADSDDPGAATTGNSRAAAITMVVRPAVTVPQVPPIARGQIF